MKEAFTFRAASSSPTTGFDVPSPPQGTQAAMSDAGLGGPGSHVLYQDFLATAASAALGFELVTANRADAFSSPTP